MNILVFSDSHGETYKMKNIIDSCPDVGAVIHSGDIARDIDSLERDYPQIPIYGVSGNNDFFCEYPTFLSAKIGEINFFITHGNLFSVKTSCDSLLNEALLCGCDICIYGHTHIKNISTHLNITLVNPGSIRGKNGTYAVIDSIHGNISIRNVT